MARTACLFASLVLLMATATKKGDAYPWKAGTSSGHITNLKQSILETFDIYVPMTTTGSILAQHNYKNGDTV
jgi:hypothetical protein